MTATMIEMPSATRTRLEGHLSASVRHALDLTLELRRALKALEQAEHEGTLEEVRTALETATQAAERLGVTLRAGQKLAA